MFWLAQLRQRICSGVFPRSISYPFGGQSWCREDTHASPGHNALSGPGFPGLFREES